MPKVNRPLDLAAHYTQLYYEWYKNGGNSHDDITSLELNGLSVSKAANKEGAGKEVRDLNQDIQAFMKQVQDNARYLADGGTDRNQIKSGLENASKLAGNVIKGFKQVPPEEARQYDGVDDDGIDAKDSVLKDFEDADVRPANRGGAVLKAAGESKSAAKWIETFQKGVKKGQEISRKDVAKIFAARQLANAQLGKRANIDKTVLSEMQIQAQADKLLASPEFGKYADQVKNFDAKLFRDGHGGKLEQTFVKFLADEGQAKPEFDIRNRYGKQISEQLKVRGQQSEWVDVDGAQVRNEFNNDRIKVTPKERPQYKSFKDYFTRNSAENLEGTLSPVVRAARMAAADDFARKNPEKPFSRKALDDKARRFMKDPGFKIVSRLPESEKIIKGDAKGFAEDVAAVNIAADNMLDGINGRLKPGGYIEPSLARLEKLCQDEPEDFGELKAVTDSIRNLQSGKDHKPQEVINAIGGILDYQDKHIGDKLSSKGAAINDSMRLLNELTKGSHLEALVDHQIEKVNAARNSDPSMGKSQYLTTEHIAQEGRDMAKAEQQKQQLAQPKAEPAAKGPVA